MNWIKLLGLVTLAWILALRAQAEVIEIPQEELAKESVLPIFDRPVSVKNRNVATAGRFDMSLAYGMALSEPIFNANRYGIAFYYNTSEDNAWGIKYEKISSGLSTYANQLAQPGFDLDFSRVPYPDSTLMGEWDWKLFYGKMSVTKNTVINTSLYTSLSAGIVKFTHKSYPGIAPGIGQKFYFGQSFSLRFDVRLYANQAPIPFLDSTSTTDGSGVLNTKPTPTPDKFSERLTYTTVLNAGLSWLF